YLNTPLPPVLGKDDEIGLKTDFLNGRISSSVAVYAMSLTNQAIPAPKPLVNIAGLNYSIPIGPTVSKGWDSALAFLVLPGLQVIATGYSGTVHDQNNNPITGTYDNSWSLFARYDFDHASPLRGLGVGGGAVRIGGRYFNEASLTPANGVAPPLN